MSPVLAVIAILSYIGSSRVIEDKNERALFVGKLKHNWTILILNGVSFCGIVAVAAYPPLTLWSILLSLLFLVPILGIPYNGRYNVSFMKGWARYQKLKHVTFVATAAAIVFI